jgi:hypothetical protein
MKAQVLELLAVANEQLNHDVYSKAEVIQLINNLRNQIGDLPDQEVAINDDLINQINRMANKFDFEYDINISYDNKIEVDVTNAEDLVSEIIDLIQEVN